MDTYYFTLKNNNNASDYSQKLEKIFLANGMNAESLLDNIKENQFQYYQKLLQEKINLSIQKAQKNCQ